MCHLRKHSSASVTDGQTDGRTDGQTNDGQSDPYVSLCFTGDTKSIFVLLHFVGSLLVFYMFSPMVQTFNHIKE